MILVLAFVLGIAVGASVFLVSLGAQARWSIRGVIETLRGRRLFVDVSGDPFVVPVGWDYRYGEDR